jgi:hypothetical protein
LVFFKYVLRLTVNIGVGKEVFFLILIDENPMNILIKLVFPFSYSLLRKLILKYPKSPMKIQKPQFLTFLLIKYTSRRFAVMRRKIK